jgi:hypothetical protein
MTARYRSFAAAKNSSPQLQSLAKAQSRKENKWVLLCGFAPLRDTLFFHGF